MDKSIEEQAKELAEANRSSDSNIAAVYWIPHPEEIHLVEVDRVTVNWGEDTAQPFYFNADTTLGLSAPSGIALIHPEQVNNIKLPEGWGRWEDAKLIAGEEE